MTNRIYSTFVLVAALGLPSIALADVTGTQTLSSGQIFSFSAGAVVTSGGDVQWTGSALNLVNGAKAFDIPSSNQTVYSAINQAAIQQYASFLVPTSAPLPASTLTAGNVFVVQTGSGSYAKVIITTDSGGSLGFQFDYFGSATTGGGGGNTPSITAIQDAGSYTSSIAEGSVFVVKGTNLSAAGFTSTSYPLPQASNGVSINFTPVAGGSSTAAYIVYLYNQNGVNQLAGILPSTVKAGGYQVTVQNSNGTSAPLTVTVTATKPGLVTQDSSGSGLAVVQNYISATQLDINRFTTGSVNGASISPAHPGQTLIAWLTGMGPVPFADNSAPNGGQGYNFLSNGGTVQVFIGGTPITPFYAGRAPCCAGEDQIDFTLPNNISTGCVVPFQVVVNGNVSQSSFISIAPTGASVCTLPGFSASQLQSLDNGSTITSGSIAISAESSNVPSFGPVSIYQGSADFTKYTGFELSGVAGAAAASAAVNNTCIVIPINGAQIDQFASASGTDLDAGTLKLTGPSGSNLSGTAFTETNNVYSLNIGQMGFPSQVASQYGNGVLVPGTYTVAAGGGTDIKAFSTSITLPTLFSVTGGVPTTVNRSAGLTINWTGGNSSDIVEISGLAENGSPSQGAEFICITTNAPKTFTVPASILSQLPAVTSANITAQSSTGSLTVFNIQPGNAFTAPLVSGGNVDFSSIGATFGTASESVVYQ